MKKAALAERPGKRHLELMTLFIACLLIYAFGLNPWLYAVAVAVWTAQLIVRGRIGLTFWREVRRY